MGGFFDSSHNAAVRGYILRSLVKGYHFSCVGTVLSNKMLAAGLITNPDISEYLYYLEQKKLIEFSGDNTNSFNVLQNNEVIRLTASGIRFVETGGESDSGIDL